MAVDTRNRRASVLGFARGGVPVWPNPDGDITGQADRQHNGYSYPGILVSAAAALVYGWPCFEKLAVDVPGAEALAVDVPGAERLAVDVPGAEAMEVSC